MRTKNGAGIWIPTKLGHQNYGVNLCWGSHSRTVLVASGIWTTDGICHQMWRLRHERQHPSGFLPWIHVKLQGAPKRFQCSWGFLWRPDRWICVVFCGETQLETPRGHNVRVWLEAVDKGHEINPSLGLIFDPLVMTVTKLAIENGYLWWMCPLIAWWIFA